MVAEKSKMSQLIRSQGGHIDFSIGLDKNTILVEDVEYLLPVKFRQILWRTKVEIRHGLPSWCTYRSEQKWYTNLVEDVGYFLPSKFRQFHSTVTEEKSKMSKPIRGQNSHLGWRKGPKYTNLVEDVGYLFPVRFRQISFSDFMKKSKMWKS